MELQDFVIKGITSQLRFRTATPHFMDRSGQLIAEAMDQYGLTEWRSTPQFVEVFRRDQTHAVLIGSHELRAIFENVEDASAVKDRTKSLFEAKLAELEVDALSFVGVRTFWLAAADDFADLHDWMLERLSPTVKPLLEKTGSKPTDSGWVFELTDKDPKHNLKLGPMKPEQAKDIFRDQNEENYPPQFLFLDLDRVYSDDDSMSRQTALDRWEKSFSRNLEIAQALAEDLTAA